MAQVWQRLGDTYADGTVLHAPSGGADQPVMQQQQQVQPGDEKE
jgi:hypothetical protein